MDEKTRAQLRIELQEISNRYARARYHLKVATSEAKLSVALAEFKAASIARTKARRALLRAFR